MSPRWHNRPLSGKKEQASEQHEPELEGRVQIVEAEANEMRAAAQAAAAAAAAIEHNEQQKVLIERPPFPLTTIPKTKR